MRKSGIILASLLLSCLLMVSGCTFSKNHENTIDTEQIESVNNDVIVEESEVETEDVTESTQVTETIESTEAEQEESEVAETEETTTSKEPEKTSENQQSTDSQQPSDNQKPTDNQKPSDSQKPTDSQQPSESQKPTDSQKPADTQTPPESEEPEIYVVDMETERETLAPENYKYGVAKVGVIDRTYEVYSDGSRVCVAEYPSYSYDSSTYSASDAEIQPESDANCNSYMSYYNEVLSLVNQIRAEAGVEPLSLDTNMCRAASMRALEMDYADYFEHARADGRDCFSVMEYYSCSQSTAGENIAAGQRSPSEVVESWKNSSGHYANMIDADFSKLGVGYSNAGIGSYGTYWVQLFSN